MDRPAKFSNGAKHNWMTLDVLEEGDKFILEEKGKRQAAKHIVETAFFLFVGILLLGSIFIFLLPDMPILGDSPGVFLPLELICTALFLYTFATRGYKPQVGLDKGKKQIWFCKLNSQGHARLVTRFAKKDVRSMYIKRTQNGSDVAELVARFNGKALPLTLLTGSLEDIEAAHTMLSLALKNLNSETRGESNAVGVNRRDLKKRIITSYSSCRTA